MLVWLFWSLMVAATAAAVVIWVLAARVAWDIRSREGAGIGRRLLVALWPFSARHATVATPEAATLLQRMLISLFIAILVATPALAVYRNLTLVLPAPVQ